MSSIIIVLVMFVLMFLAREYYISWKKRYSINFNYTFNLIILNPYYPDPGDLKIHLYM
jgi:hypothetical protein